MLRFINTRERELFERLWLGALDLDVPFLSDRVVVCHRMLPSAIRRLQSLCAAAVSMDAKPGENARCAVAASSYPDAVGW